jgi:hypothetical protein
MAGFVYDLRSGCSGSHCLAQVLVDLVEEAGGREPWLVGADQQRQILGHEAAFDRVNANPFQCVGELCQLSLVVELCAVSKTTRPGEDRGDRVGRGLLAAGGSGASPCRERLRLRPSGHPASSEPRSSGRASRYWRPNRCDDEVRTPRNRSDWFAKMEIPQIMFAKRPCKPPPSTTRCEPKLSTGVVPQ